MIDYFDLSEFKPFESEAYHKLIAMEVPLSPLASSSSEFAEAHPLDTFTILCSEHAAP